MVGEAKIKNGIFSDKENLLGDVSKVYKEGLHSDITFILADNVSISTNRFMLACRIPYFATMLFGGYAEKSSVPVPLECCNSETFKRILDFVWEGEISFTDMNILSLLNLLETSRFLCIDLLVEGIVDYVKHLLESKNVELKDCLVALDFSMSHKFTIVANFILNFIDQNLSIISSLPEFSNLSGYSMMALLSRNYAGRISSDIVMFGAFVKWLENKDSLPANTKKEMLSCFELEQFSNTDLMNTVRKTDLFDDKDICDVLEKRLDELGGVLVTNKEQIENQENLIEEQKKQVKESEATLKSNKRLIATQKKQINECGPITLRMTPQDNKLLDSKFRTKWQMNLERFINGIQFNLDSSVRSSYYLKSSLDGINWNEIVNYKEIQYTGTQTIHFERRKMKFLDIVVGSHYADAFHGGSVKDVFAIML